MHPRWLVVGESNLPRPGTVIIKEGVHGVRVLGVCRVAQAARGCTTGNVALEAIARQDIAFPKFHCCSNRLTSPTGERVPLFFGRKVDFVTSRVHQDVADVAFD